MLAKAMGRTRQIDTQTSFIALGAGAGGGFKASDEAINQRWEYGKGRVAWIPQAVITGKYNAKIPAQIWMIENTFWDVPGNWKEILAALDWVLGQRWIPLQVPARVIPQVSRKTGSKKELLIHLLNYDRNTPVRDLNLNVSKELGTPGRVFWRTPENPDARELAVRTTPGSTLLNIPEFVHHGTIIYSE